MILNVLGGLCVTPQYASCEPEITFRGRIKYVSLMFQDDSGMVVPSA